MAKLIFTQLLKRIILQEYELNIISWFHCSTQSQKKKEIKIDMEKFPCFRIRNFGIIAHVDHGKSTLSDRLMELTGNISKEVKNEQVLDKLQVERERGITVKAHTVSLFYHHKEETFLLNLIDTPGHVDFSYEVDRSLAACQGVLLLVDANQGIEAQSVANFNLAFSRELVIIPVINKIDLKNAKPNIVSNQLISFFGFKEEEILKISAKFGLNIEEIFTAIIDRIPLPPGDINKPFRALLYDSWYAQPHGVNCLIMVVDGCISAGDEVTSTITGCSYTIKEIGILFPDKVPVKKLCAGQAGYFVANIKKPQLAVIGDTWFKKECCVEPLPSIHHSKPMVFAGIFPSDQSRTQDLKKAVEKLILNDSSVTSSIETSPALGVGYRLGFLGLLHMEVFCQRLDQEFDAQVIISTPGVPYKIKIVGAKNVKEYGTDELIISDPSKLPDPCIISSYFEPMVLGTIITPDKYYSAVLKLCMDRRGQQRSAQNIDDHTFILVYKFPLSEIIVNFFDELKSVSSGYASFDYEEIGYEPTDLKKIDILLNGKIVDELSVITHASQVERVARSMCLSLKENIKPHLFLIAIQACVGKKVIARENIKALKKNVTAKLYGGDVTRRMKLMQRQKEGKKHMRMIGNVEVPRDAIIKILRKS